MNPLTIYRLLLAIVRKNDSTTPRLNSMAKSCIWEIRFLLVGLVLCTGFLVFQHLVLHSFTEMLRWHNAGLPFFFNIPGCFVGANIVMELLFLILLFSLETRRDVGSVLRTIRVIKSRN